MDESLLNKRAKQQQTALEFCMEQEAASACRERIDAVKSSSAVKALVERGYVTVSEKRILRNSYAGRTGSSAFNP